MFESRAEDVTGEPSRYLGRGVPGRGASRWGPFLHVPEGHEQVGQELVEGWVGAA